MKTDMEVARSRLLAVVQADAMISASDCEIWVDTLAGDGSWPDLDYGDSRRSGWAPRMHWRRIRDLSFQSASAQVSDDPVADVGPVIERAIQFWVDDPPVRTNWWHNAIGVPLEMDLTIGPVRYPTEEGVVTAPGSFVFEDSLTAVEHDGVGYVSPDFRQVQLDVEDRVGSWQTINRTGSATPLSDGVFSLSFDLAPDDYEGYHYFILPGAISGIEGSMEAIQRWKVVRNDTDCQAVHDTGRDELHAVFYAQGRVTLENGFSLRAFQPCTVILEFLAEGLVVHAADPSKSLDRIVLSISGRQLDFDLPQGSLRRRAIKPVRLTGISE